MRRALIAALLLVACGRTPAVDPPRVEAPQQQPLKGCEGRSLVVLEGRRLLTRVSAEGTQTLFTFGAGLPDDRVGVTTWSVAGGYIGAAASFDDGTFVSATEVVLLDASGALLFHRTLHRPLAAELFLGSDGSLAVAGETGFIAHADGSVTELGDLFPLTPVLSDGAVVVAQGKPWFAATRRGLWRAGTFTPFALAPDDSATFQVVGRRAVYVSGATLSSVTDGLQVRLPGSGFRVAQQAGGRFVLLVSDHDRQVVRVDLDAATAHPVSDVPAVNERYSAWDLGLQSDGAVLAGASLADGRLQLRRTTDLGATWSDVGEPMQPGMDFGVGRWLLPIEHAGNVLTLSMSTGYGHYLNAVQLSSARGNQHLDLGQVYVNVDLSPGAADLSSDGQCAAAWVQTSVYDFLHLELLDADGTVVSLQTRPAAGWLRFLD